VVPARAVAGSLHTVHCRNAPTCLSVSTHNPRAPPLLRSELVLGHGLAQKDLVWRGSVSEPPGVCNRRRSHSALSAALPSSPPAQGWLPSQSLRSRKLPRGTHSYPPSAAKHSAREAQSVSGVLPPLPPPSLPPSWTPELGAPPLSQGLAEGPGGADACGDWE